MELNEEKINIKSLILRIVAYIVLFASSVGFIFSFLVMMFCMNEDVYQGESSDYFHSYSFTSEFSNSLSRLMNAVNEIDFQESDRWQMEQNIMETVFGGAMETSEYGGVDETSTGFGEQVRNVPEDKIPLRAIKNTYLQDFVNMQYAVFDEKGEVVISSGGFNEKFLQDPDNYYLTIDIGDVNEKIKKYDLEVTYYNYTKERDQSLQVAYLGTNLNSNSQAYWGLSPIIENIEGSYLICTYVNSSLEGGDGFYDSHEAYYRYLRWGDSASVACGICFIVFLVTLIFMIITTKKKLFWFDRIPTEISAAVIILLLTFLIMIIMNLRWEVRRFFTNGYIGTGDIALYTGIYATTFSVGVIGLFSLVRRIKCSTLISNALIYRFFQMCREVVRGMVGHNLMRKYVVMVVAAGLLDIFLLFVAANRYSGMWWMIFFLAVACEILYAALQMLQFQKIAEGALRISQGELDYKINTKYMGSTMKTFAETVNNIGDGLGKAIDESVKSERMKADLITNVSHDIKTPLTSIINYVDLLKRENISQEPAREYIDILDSKSQRLKSLTEDLVEASRASSGNIKLEKNNIDFVELVSQVIGSYADKFEEKHLEVITNLPDPPVTIYADGRRLYRVLENLMINGYKYSMEGTRIYMDLIVEEKKAVYTMKNISAQPLNITPEELTQRFVRGDVSRTTEGSGLGLSIARSLTELHDGKFNIYLDGDLFKVSITFPLSQEETVNS